MAQYPYDQLGTPLDTANLEKANGNWAKIAADIASVDSASQQRDAIITSDYTTKLLQQKNEYTGRLDLQKTRIDNIVSEISSEAFEMVVDVATVNRSFEPVSNFSELSTTYPDARNGDAVQTLDDNKTYRFNGTEWVFIEQFGSGPFTEVFNRLDEQKYFVNVVEYGAVGDGVTDDTLAFSTAWNDLDDGGTLVVPSGKTFLVNNVSFTDKTNVTLLLAGNVLGNTQIYTTTVTSLSSANSTITVSDPTHFRVGDQYSVRGGSYTASRHAGTITQKSGNVLTISTNSIGEGLTAISTGEQVVLTSSLTEYRKITFERCVGITLKGSLSHNVEFKQCSNVEVDLTMTNASLDVGFCKDVTIKRLSSNNAPFYGLFFYSSRRVNLGEVALRESNFSGLVFKSTWDVNVGNLLIHNPALMAVQIVTNTNPGATIPSLTDPELQNDLTSRYYNFGSIVVTQAILGLYITQLAYNINISNYQYHDSRGNALRATTDTNDIKIGKMTVRNHSAGVDDSFTTSYPVLVDGSKRIDIESLKVETSRGERPFSIRNTEDIRLGSVTLKDTRGSFQIADSKLITISSVNFEDSRPSYANFEFGNVEDLKLLSATLRNISGSITSRVINLTGNCKRVTFRDVAVLSKDGSIFAKGFVLTPTTCDGLTLNNIYIENCTDALTVDKATKVKVTDSTIGDNCYNGMIFNATTGDGLIITNNVFPLTRGLIDNSTTLKKFVGSNVTI